MRILIILLHLPFQYMLLECSIQCFSLVSIRWLGYSSTSCSCPPWCNQILMFCNVVLLGCIADLIISFSCIIFYCLLFLLRHHYLLGIIILVHSIFISFRTFHSPRFVFPTSLECLDHQAHSQVFHCSCFQLFHPSQVLPLHPLLQ